MISVHCRQCSHILRLQAICGIRHSTTVAKKNRKLGHYEVLELNSKASQEEIKEAFFKLSKQIHPDLNPHEPKNHENFIRLKEAYTVLSNPASRREYDFSVAASINYHRMATKNMYTTNTSGSSFYPSSGPSQGFRDGEQREKIYWDETILSMRDKTKDKDRFYPEDSYYGIKNIKRLPNSYIVGVCFVIIGLGIVLNILQFTWSHRVRTQILDRKDAKNSEHLRLVRERARLNGTDQQLKIMFGDKLNSPSSD